MAKQQQAGAPPIALTEAQVSALTGLTVQSLRTRRRRGGGPPFRKLGQRVLYLREDVEAWMRSLPEFRVTPGREAVR